MNHISLPALDGRSPLGVLAAMGLLRLLDSHTDDTARLAWDTTHLTARLETTRSSIDEIVDDLRGIVSRIPPGAVLPEMPAGLPPVGEAPDKLRMPPERLRDYADGLVKPAGTEAEAWIASLVTDLVVDDAGRVGMSLFSAPAGKQSTRTMLEKPLEFVRKNPQVLLESLSGWRRYDGVTGEYLDHRALFDATDAGGGQAVMRGVPGATWLALMSYPLFRTTAIGRRTATSGWHVQDRKNTLVLPIWRQPLGVDAVTALVEHPIFAAKAVGITPAMRDLGVIDLCRARRRQQPGSKSAGVLSSLR